MSDHLRERVVALRVALAGRSLPLQGTGGGAAGYQQMMSPGSGRHQWPGSAMAKIEWPAALYAASTTP